MWSWSQGIADRYLYNGKELQTTGNLDYLDYGARMYSPRLGRWFNPDPLAEKYFPVSPYTYTLNNPIKFVDPDGKKIEFGKNVSDTFKQKFALTVKYMNKKGTSANIAKLQKSDNVYYVSEGDGGFNRETNTITWNPQHIIKTDKNVLLFPATVLAHEFGHAAQKERDPSFADSATEDAQYGTSVEAEVIKGVEQEAALKHGDISEGEVTRSNHEGVTIVVPILPEGKIAEDYKIKLAPYLKENK